MNVERLTWLASACIVISMCFVPGCFQSTDVPLVEDEEEEQPPEEEEVLLSLTVELRTDYDPLAEFDLVRTVSGELLAEHPAQPGDDWMEGVTIAEFSVPEGRRELTIELLRGDEVVAERQVLTVVSEEQNQVTVILTRRCTGPECELMPDEPGPDDPDMMEPGTMDPSCDAPRILANSCAVNASCHGPGWGFDVRVDEAELIQTLVEADAGGSCTGDRLVVPGDPDTSALFLRITGSSCGNQMPLTGGPLAPDEIDCVRTWIETL